MAVLELSEGIGLLIVFALVMLALTLKFTNKVQNTKGFLLADRNVGLISGSFSMAVSWIWAPAIFICSLQAYQNGLAGIFWFTVPNVLCFFIFAPFALRLRQEMPDGYTFTEYIYKHLL